MLSTPVSEGKPPIEFGAIETAKVRLKHLIDNQIAPPQVTTMGDDAIVMLWAIGDATAAVTITDGELGHVVRRQRKTIKRQSNIKPETFNLLGPA